MLRWPSWASVPNEPMVSVDVKQHLNNNKKLFLSEPVWPSGMVLVRLVSRRTSVRIRFGSFSSKVVVCGHCLVTLSITINETLKWL